MEVLHTMFSTQSNTAFNNKAFSGRTIQPMHETMSRLTKASFDLKGAQGPAQIARLLGESEQTLTNWAKRGVSVPGAVKAELMIGCPAIWVLYGKGEPVLTTEQQSKHTYVQGPSLAPLPAREPWPYWPFFNISKTEWERLTPAQKQAAELLVRAYISGLANGDGDAAAA